MGASYEIENNVDEVMTKIKKEQKKRATQVALEAESDIKEVLRGGGSGREYYIPGTGTTYRASSPGEPPAVRLGELLGSIAHFIEEDSNAVHAIVGTPKEHGLHTEFGTMNMAARPWLRPTMKKHQNKYKAIYAGRWF